MQVTLLLQPDPTLFVRLKLGSAVSFCSGVFTTTTTPYIQKRKFWTSQDEAQLLQLFLTRVHTVGGDGNLNLTLPRECHSTTSRRHHKPPFLPSRTTKKKEKKEEKKNKESLRSISNFFKFQPTDQPDGQTYPCNYQYPLFLDFRFLE